MKCSPAIFLASSLIAMLCVFPLPAHAQALCGNGAPDPGEECDDGNTTGGDGCSADCQLDSGGGFDCTAAVAATPPVNLVGDGSFEDLNLNGDWTIIEHSLFGSLLCDDGCFGGVLGSDLDGNVVSGAFVLVAGGSFSSASTGAVEHAPIVIPEDGTLLQFNWGIGTVGGTGAPCAGPDDGMRLLIDGVPVWSNLDETPNGQCVGVNVYTVVDIDLAALGLNDNNEHVIRFEGAASVVPTEDDLTNIFLDQIRIFVEADDAQPAIPSMCTEVICGDGLFPQFSARGAEECDDGNTTDGDGCSALCTVEQPNFVCTDPRPPADEGNVIQDGGLEGGLPNGPWTVSPADGVNTLFNPVCSQATCAGAALGDVNAFGEQSAWYAWFGRSVEPNVQFIEQRVTIPATATTIDFNLLIGICDSTNDTLKVLVDGSEVYNLGCVDEFPTYTPQSADITAFADGDTHVVQFEGKTVSSNGGRSNFFVDNIRLGDNLPFAGEPGSCTMLSDACTVPEQFDAGIPADWTVINLGPDAADGWGVSNDGLCASGNWSDGNAQNNVAGGGGVAACADADATGQNDADLGGPALEMNTYLCTPPLDLANVTLPALSFRVNYQSADNDLNNNGTPDDSSDDFDDDLFEVLIGTDAPSAASLAGYTTLSGIEDHLDTTLLDSPDAAVSLALAAYTAQGDAYVCFHYLGTYAWFAQVDNVALRGQACVADTDTDGDGITDAADNCTLAANPSQLDTDNDGYGNACDGDFDQSCLLGIVDLGILRVNFFALGNLETDMNGDGVTNVIDLGIFRQMFFQPPGPSAFGTCGDNP